MEIIKNNDQDKIKDIENQDSAHKNEADKEALYNEALKKFGQKTSKTYKAGISDLEGLGDWRDVAEEIGKRKAELLEIEIKEKEKRKKLKKKILIGVAVIVAAIICGITAKKILTPNLADYTVNYDEKLNSMKYKLPKECLLEDLEDNIIEQYSLNENGKAIAVIEVEYKGDSDLSGDAGYDSKFDEHDLSDSALELIPDASGKYKDIEADNSVFEVTIYCNEDKVDGADTLLDNIAKSFDVEGYKNPRTSKRIKAQYIGDTSAGVKIKEGVEDLSVKETYETVKGTGAKDVSYKIKHPVSLKAGETSKVNIVADGRTCVLKIKCSDHAPFYKNGHFTASLDDIMSDYSENYDSIHLSSGSTGAGGSIDIRKIDDTYGSKFTDAATDNSFVITFSGMNESGSINKATSKVPTDLLMMINAEGIDIESEDLLCMAALFGNMFSNINPDVDQNEACNEVKDALVDAEGSITRTYKGIKYTLKYSGSIIALKIEG